VLREAAGKSVIGPNWIFPLDPPTGPPFMLLGTFALIVTEPFQAMIGGTTIHCRAAMRNQRRLGI
jgi:hypothetical protein